MRKIYFQLTLSLFALFVGITSVAAQSNNSSVTVSRDTLIVHSAVYYDSNVREPQRAEVPKLAKIYDWMSSNDAIVRLVGYADQTGSVAYNRALALSRAEGIKKYLVNRGIAPSRITSYGDGIDNSVSDALARRVDIFQVEVKTKYTANQRTVEVIKEVPVEVIREVRVVDTIYVDKPIYENKNKEQTKYSIGVDLGMPYGVSTLRSRGAEESHAGYSAGIYARYHFSKALTFDAFVSIGAMTMSYECCPYYLSSDGKQYYSSISTDNGAYCNELYSRARLTEFGVRANYNLFSLINSLKDSKFALKLSPSIGMGVSNAKIRSLSDDRIIYDPKAKCSFALGGDIVAAYNITPNLEAELYTGLTRFCGARIDGMPRGAHKNNRTITTGLRFNCRILKKQDNE